MNETYIAVWRKSIDHPMFNIRPFDDWHAWEYLLLTAQFKPTDFMLCGEVIHLEQGQLFRSMKTLSDTFGWTYKKTRNFINTLKKQNMVLTEGTSKGTTITIVNYTFYQVEGRADGRAKGTAKGERWANGGRHNNKGNKVNKVKERERGDLPLVSYGKFHNVLLTRTEYQEVTATYQNPKNLINKIGAYLSNADRIYENHAALLYKIATEDKWPRKAKEIDAPQPKELSPEEQEAADQARKTAMDKVNAVIGQQRR